MRPDQYLQAGWKGLFSDQDVRGVQNLRRKVPPLLAQLPFTPHMPLRPLGLLLPAHQVRPPPGQVQRSWLPGTQRRTTGHGWELPGLPHQADGRSLQLTGLRPPGASSRFWGPYVRGALPPPCKLLPQGHLTRLPRTALERGCTQNQLRTLYAAHAQSPLAPTDVQRTSLQHSVRVISPRGLSS